MFKKISVFILSLVFLVAFKLANASVINQQLKVAMQTQKVPVVSYAIIDDYKITSVAAISINPSIKVSNESLFQAASISKSFTALALLQLIEKNKVSLDKPANEYLHSWKIPSNKFTAHHSVSVRNLLDMTSGLLPSGFAGYSKGQRLPNPIQLLNGQPPANNVPVTVSYQPGSKYFYSGGAFQVAQQIIVDQTQENFKQYMNSKVLPLLNMTHSVFQYPLEKPWLNKAIPAYQGWNEQPIAGGWHNYAISGSGGLWATPTDLAKFLLAITSAYHGKDNAVLSKKMAQQMVTRNQNTDFGLGFVVSGSGNNLYFWKAGHNYGYHSLIIMFPNVGKGIAIMTNSETGDTVIDYILPIIAKIYHWPPYFPFFDELINIPDLEKLG